MTEDDLVAAIRADPDSDVPRMVYADWLQQQGDPLGEWIALSLVDPPSQDVARRLVALGRELRWTERHGADPAHERGLVSRMKLVAHAMTPELLDRMRGTLIRELDLSGWRPSPVQWRVLVRALANMAPRRLRVEMYLPADELAELLALCPGLVDLELVHAELDDNRTAVVARARLPALTRLAAIGYPHAERSHRLLGDAGALALARSRARAGLRALTLRSWNIAARGAAALVDLPALETLDLANNRLGAAGVIGLAERPSVARLRALNVAGAGIDDAAAAVIAGAPALANLRHLVLGHGRWASGLSRAGLDALIASPHLSPELVLELDNEALAPRRAAVAARFRIAAVEA
jgi:uncharacterized protein (TIGR02996 family)